MYYVYYNSVLCTVQVMLLCCIFVYCNSQLCTVQVMLVSLEKLATSADVCVAALDRLLTLLPLLSGTAAVKVSFPMASFPTETTFTIKRSYITPHLKVLCS